jgi:large subunit ribosomal protein L25
MALTFEIPAESRDVKGKGASRRLRRMADKVPGVIYGAHKEAQSIMVDHNYLLKALEHQAFYSHILTVKVNGKAEKVVLKDLQRHPYKPRILHLDLLRISAKDPITMRIPLHFLGDDVAPGVKVGGGLVSHMLNDVEVRCLPANLPEFIEVDMSKVELDHTLHLSDLKLAKGVELTALLHDDDLPVASIHLPRGAAADEAEASTSADEVPTVAAGSEQEEK